LRNLPDIKDKKSREAISVFFSDYAIPTTNVNDRQPMTFHSSPVVTMALFRLVFGILLTT